MSLGTASRRRRPASRITEPAAIAIARPRGGGVASPRAPVARLVPTSRRRRRARPALALRAPCDTRHRRCALAARELFVRHVGARARDSALRLVPAGAGVGRRRLGDANGPAIRAVAGRRRRLVMWVRHGRRRRRALSGTECSRRAKSCGDCEWRRGSESNRRRRLCRPLHDHSATPPRVGRPRCEPRPGQTKRESWLGRDRLSLREYGAGKESRTPDLNLGKVALYQLSYSRVVQP